MVNLLCMVLITLCYSAIYVEAILCEDAFCSTGVIVGMEYHLIMNLLFYVNTS